MKKKSSLVILFTAVILALFLRGFNLGSMISPYWEEVALGYDAYSLAQTGADHHGNAWPTVAFESFGDWKPSGYFYLAAAVIKVLGLSVFSVRLPSMLAGVSIVIGMYFFSKLLMQRFAATMPTKQKEVVAVLSVVLAAVSSWLIMFSRAAWEVNVATAFLLWGSIIFLSSIKTRNILYLFPSALFFALSAYTYHATRVIAPLIFLGLLTTTFIEAVRTRQTKAVSDSMLGWFPKTEITLGMIFLALLIPLIVSMRSSTVTQRFAETSIFSNVSIIEESNQAIELANTPGDRYFFHRYVLFTREILKNAFSHLSLDFLFIHGDNNKRHSTGFMGLLYYLDAVLLVVGAYALAKRYRTMGIVILAGVIVGLFPASVSLATPHSLRILPIAPFVMVVLALGASELYFWGRTNYKRHTKTVLVSLCVLAYAVQVIAFWRYYTAVYPKESALEWQYGYSDTMFEVHKYVENGKSVAVSRTYGRPAMYYFFVNSLDPFSVQSRDDKERMDQSEFLTFNSLTFFDDAKQTEQADVVFVSPQNTDVIELLQQDGATVVYEKSSPLGLVLWQAYEKK